MNTVPLEPVPLASTKFDATGVEGIATEGPSWVVLKTIAWATLAALFWILDGVRRKMKGERLEDHAPRIESRVDGTASEFGDPGATGISAKLPLAPWWASLYSFSLYVYLWGCGVAHIYRAAHGTPNIQQVKADTTLIVLLYLCETIGAFAVHRSTMYNWRQLDFGLHHVPFVLVVGAAVLLEDENLVHMFRFTLPLDLMTSANEAVAAARSLGGPAWIDIPNRFYMLALMATLVVAELYEAVMVLTTPGFPGRFYMLAACTFPAPIYHACMVMPHCWKVVRRWSRAKLNGEEYTRKPKSAAVRN